VIDEASAFVNLAKRFPHNHADDASQAQDSRLLQRAQEGGQV
jgi:hypothetical protein